MMYAKAIFAGLLVLFSAYAEATSPMPGGMAPNFHASTTDGTPLELHKFRGRWVVLEWTNHECPYVRKHYSSGNMQKTQRALTEEGALWISIISSAPGKQGYVTAEEADQLTAQRGVYADMVVLDPSGEIGRLYNARTTPQMFLIDPAGNIRYMGAIDDRPSSRPASLEGATNYLLSAWDAVKEGQEVSPAATKPYGCSVKYAD